MCARESRHPRAYDDAVTDHDTETADPYPHLLTTRLERRPGRVVLAATCRPGGHFRIADERAGPIRMLVHGVRVASAAAAAVPGRRVWRPAARRRRARRAPRAPGPRRRGRGRRARRGSPLSPVARRRPPTAAGTDVEPNGRSRTGTWCAGSSRPAVAREPSCRHDDYRAALRRRASRRGPSGFRRDLEHLLEETADAGVTRFVWLRQFEWELSAERIVKPPGPAKRNSGTRRPRSASRSGHSRSRLPPPPTVTAPVVDSTPVPF